MDMYPLAPISPRPDPDEAGEIHFWPDVLYWLEPALHFRTPASQDFIGLPPVCSGAFRVGNQVFQAFLQEVYLHHTLLYWFEPGPLDIPETFDEADSRNPNRGVRNIGDFYTWGDSLSSLGWLSVFQIPDHLRFHTLISRPVPFQCFAEPAQQWDGQQYIDGYYYEAAHLGMQYYYVGWLCIQADILSPSLIPFLPAILPFLPLPFLPLPLMLPFGPLMGIVNGLGAAANAPNTSAGRRRKV